VQLDAFRQPAMAMPKLRLLCKGSFLSSDA